MNNLCARCRYPEEICKCLEHGLDEALSIEDALAHRGANKGAIEPTHYTQFAIPPNVYITENNLVWEEGNIVKYVTRHRFKNGKEDLLKARKYIDLLIERMYTNG